MRRIYLEVGQVVSKPKGGEMIFHAPAFYNVDDELADLWVDREVACEVGPDGELIARKEPEEEVAPEKKVVFDPDPSLGFDSDVDADEEV